MSTKKILESSLKYLNGFLPLNKPRGVCCNKLLYSLRTDLHFVLNQHDVSHGQIEVNYARPLEPFATGLVTFILGKSNYRRRNFVFADYKYRATIELGVEREFHCIDGKILGHAKIDHLSENIIETAIQTFPGTTIQKRSLHFITKQSSLQSDESNVESIYDLINLPSDKIEKPKQKYPYFRPQKEATCHSIKLLDYLKPFATLDISCQGCFSIRQLVFDLAETLGTKASLVELTRLEEGPISLEDMRVLQLHEMNLEYYIHRMPSIQNIYKNYISKFDDLFETDSYRARI